jgi:AcrR family transcriptional regulator
LRKAAVGLFLERGYDRVTVSEIAVHAKLTERTFFRYFADKREVLFSGTEEIEKVLVSSISAAPQEQSPLDVVTAAFEATSPLFASRRAFARTLHALIGAHLELRERELVKLAHVTSTVARALRERGLTEATASLVAETGTTIFRTAFERWVRGAKQDLALHVRASLVELRVLAADGAPPVSSVRRKKSTPTRLPHAVGAFPLGARSPTAPSRTG